VSSASGHDSMGALGAWRTRLDPSASGKRGWSVVAASADQGAGQSRVALPPGVWCLGAQTMPVPKLKSQAIGPASSPVAAQPAGSPACPSREGEEMASMVSTQHVYRVRQITAALA